MQTLRVCVCVVCLLLEHFIIIITTITVVCLTFGYKVWLQLDISILGKVRVGKNKTK